MKKTTSAPSVSEKFIDQLYSADTQFTEESGKPAEIPASGFLGLLAAGYRGIVMLRKKKNQTHLYSKFTKGKKLKKIRPKKSSGS